MGKIKQFLQFNGRNIYMLAVDGQYWVALKPICDAIGPQLGEVRNFYPLSHKRSAKF